MNGHVSNPMSTCHTRKYARIWFIWLIHVVLSPPTIHSVYFIVPCLRSTSAFILFNWSPSNNSQVQLTGWKKFREEKLHGVIYIREDGIWWCLHFNVLMCNLTDLLLPSNKACMILPHHGSRKYHSASDTLSRSWDLKQIYIAFQ